MMVYELHEISVAQQNIALARVDNYVRVYGDTGWEWIPDEIKIQEYQNEINNVQLEIDYVQAELNDEK